MLAFEDLKASSLINLFTWFWGQMRTQKWVGLSDGMCHVTDTVLSDEIILLLSYYCNVTSANFS